VKKTSVYLEEALDEALALRAAEEGVTKAEFIRRTLSGAVRGSSRPRPSIIGIAGPGHGVSDDSERVDELLTETGFGA
jgi:hypothetical protein